MPSEALAALPLGPRALLQTQTRRMKPPAPQALKMIRMTSLLKKITSLLLAPAGFVAPPRFAKRRSAEPGLRSAHPSSAKLYVAISEIPLQRLAKIGGRIHIPRRPWTGHSGPSPRAGRSAGSGLSIEKGG